LLHSVPVDPEGRQLSFLHTRQGVFLAWVKHGVENVKRENAVTWESDDETVAKALRLKVQPKRLAKATHS
jgi:hypothetical protein